MMHRGDKGVCAGTAGVVSLPAPKQGTPFDSEAEASRRSINRSTSHLHADSCVALQRKKQQERAVVAGDHEAACRPLHTLPPPLLSHLPPPSSCVDSSCPCLCPCQGRRQVPRTYPLLLQRCPSTWTASPVTCLAGPPRHHLSVDCQGRASNHLRVAVWGWWWRNSSASSGRGEENSQRQYLGSHVPHAQASS
jgi:hypothetical protein